MDWMYQGSAARDITESHGERMRQQQEDQLIGQLGPEASWEQIIIKADGNV